MICFFFFVIIKEMTSLCIAPVYTEITARGKEYMKKIVFENKTSPFSISFTRSLVPWPHFHKDIEIIYVMNGSVYACADREKDWIQTGDLFISFPNQIHYYENATLGDYLLIILSPDILFELKEKMYGSIPQSNILRNVSQSEPVKLLQQALQATGDYSQTIKAGLLNQALAQLLPQLTLKPRTKTSNATLLGIMNFCSSNFAENITLEDVSKALHISKYHISHLLNDKLGLSFTAYLNNLRINHACDLLEDTDKKIADISEDVGFGSIRSFNRAFDAAMHMSPSQYRNHRKM